MDDLGSLDLSHLEPGIVLQYARKVMTIEALHVAHMPEDKVRNLLLLEQKLITWLVHEREQVEGAVRGVVLLTHCSQRYAHRVTSAAPAVLAVGGAEEGAMSTSSSKSSSSAARNWGLTLQAHDHLEVTDIQGLAAEAEERRIAAIREAAERAAESCTLVEERWHIVWEEYVRAQSGLSPGRRAVAAARTFRRTIDAGKPGR